jgi:hypothetical protein
VQSILGHRSAAFTLTVYGHLLDTDLDELAAKLEISRTLRGLNHDRRRERREQSALTSTLVVGPEGIEPST